MQTGERFTIIDGDIRFTCLVERREWIHFTPYPIKPMSMRNPLWASKKLGATKHTIGNAGCAVVCTTMILTQLYPNITPDVVTDKLTKINGFTNDGELIWEKVKDITAPVQDWDVGYFGPSDRVNDGDLIWRHKAVPPEGLLRIAEEVKISPVIMQVDFKPVTTALDSHFVLALSLAESGPDIIIIDPWDGSQTQLMQRYAQKDWDLRRAIYGLRLLRAVQVP